MSVQPRESAEKPGTRTTDQHQKPKSDIEISQAAKMRPIIEVAAEKLDRRHYGLQVGAHLAQTIARRQANELGCLFKLQGVVP